MHQPFTYSRTKMLLDDFAQVLQMADVTVLTPILGSREPNDPSITSEKLAAKIPGAVVVDSLDAGRRLGQTERRRGGSGDHPGLRRHLQGGSQDGAGGLNAR